MSRWLGYYSSLQYSVRIFWIGVGQPGKTLNECLRLDAVFTLHIRLHLHPSNETSQHLRIAVFHIHLSSLRSALWLRRRRLHNALTLTALHAKDIYVAAREYFFDAQSKRCRSLEKTMRGTGMAPNRSIRWLHSETRGASVKVILRVIVRMACRYFRKLQPPAATA